MQELIRENLSLSRFTTFEIGGPARYFVEVNSEDEVVSALEYARSRSFEVLILGGGSNILVADEGFEGLVIKISLRGIRIEEDGIRVTAAAGEDWDGFVQYCVSRNLAGIECLSGIPGLVGGTPIQNVGAYGQEVSETIETVRVYDRVARAIKSFSNQDCSFGYRESVFNTQQKHRYVVLGVTFKLNPIGNPRISYADLQRRFEGMAPSLEEVRNAILETREAKGMRANQGGADARSAGSFFKNPILTSAKYEKVRQVANAAAIEFVPHYPAADGKVKVPAAWLIENTGFQKGFTLGRAGLSTRHTLAITNRGGACAAEIIALRDLIREDVSRKFGIVLEEEPNLIGFDRM